MAAWSASRAGTRKGQRVGFPRFKKKSAATPSFRPRNKHSRGGLSAIRVGDHDRPRSVTLPGIGQVAVHDDTRRLRRMLATHRAKILFATTVGGTEVAHLTKAPKALAAGMRKQRRLAKSLSRQQKGSHNRRDAPSRGR